MASEVTVGIGLHCISAKKSIRLKHWIDAPD
jgi:hypothetical protein